MDRIDDPSAQADKFGAGKDGFTDGTAGDPSSGTIIKTDWLDGVQEELLALIETAGITPASADRDQVLEAYRKLMGDFTAEDRDDLSPRLVDTTAPSTYRCWIECGPTGVKRVYTFANSFYFAYNCEIVAGSWTADGINPCLLQIQLTGASTPFIQFEWGTLTAGAFSNRAKMKPEAMPRIAGRCNTSLGIVTGSSSTNSVGISSVTSANDSSGLVTVNFSQSFSSTDYFCQVSPSTNFGADTGVSVGAQTTGNVQVLVYDLNNGSAKNLSAFDSEFYIQCSGIY